MAALKAHQFVMEADQVMFRNGQTAFVNSNTNFVLVNQGRGTVQVAFNTVYPGPNGIGGVTVDGTVSDIQMTTDKRGNVNCNFSIQGIGISAQIFLTLTDGGNNATVTISPNFNSNTMIDRPKSPLLSATTSAANSTHAYPMSSSAPCNKQEIMPEANR